MQKPNFAARVAKHPTGADPPCKIPTAVAPKPVFPRPNPKSPIQNRKSLPPSGGQNKQIQPPTSFAQFRGQCRRRLPSPTLHSPNQPSSNTVGVSPGYVLPTRARHHQCVARLKMVAAFAPNPSFYFSHPFYSVAHFYGRGFSDRHFEISGLIKLAGKNACIRCRL